MSIVIFQLLKTLSAEKFNTNTQLYCYIKSKADCNTTQLTVPNKHSETKGGFRKEG